MVCLQALDILIVHDSLEVTDPASLVGPQKLAGFVLESKMAVLSWNQQQLGVLNDLALVGVLKRRIFALFQRRKLQFTPPSHFLQPG